MPNSVDVMDLGVSSALYVYLNSTPFCVQYFKL